MSVVLSSTLSDAPNKHRPEGNKTSEVVRRSVNYVPEMWGDRFVASSPEDLKPDAQTQQRDNDLKEEVRRMLRNEDDHVQELNLIDAVQRLGVAYHFEEEIAQALLRMYKSGRDYSDDLHAVALQFRLLRQEGYNVSPDVFMKFKDEEGRFKRTLAGDTRSLLSLYEAAHMGTHGENILDEAIAFTREHLNSALPCLHPPFSTLVELALELPLRKRIERLQTSYYISIYQEDKDRSDILLEFAKRDFNLLQLLHQEELREVSMWWKSWNFAAKLPFIRERVVECYFWILGVYFEPQYSRARKMTTKIISLTSIMDDIYDVHGTLEELDPYTDAIQRWDRSVIDQFPDYMKLHFSALLDTFDKFEEELGQEGKSYRIPYLKQVFKEVSKGYLIEEQWSNSSHVPTLEEYMTNALITSAYPMLSVASYVGMGDVATKDAFDWGVNMPKLIKAASVICRLKDDITSNQLEQERGHVASIIQIYMNENGSTYEEACEKFKRMAADAWKDINKECLKPTPAPMPILMRTVNLTRVIEVLYQHRDGYTNPEYETKERILSVLVNPCPV
ncbi:terpene synthase 1 [Cinnamomum micranthum f. kanehirae]|uniref:Terpene synthase 1 n=1 Tax=Cinnamomum micranthum f. kanehirae TaxID=337451 RepID=A0A443PRZ1_9MAGN|nr:terpene synthase 1 [Cinnamomum micranthum f. kanehirae]